MTTPLGLATVGPTMRPTVEQEEWISAARAQVTSDALRDLAELFVDTPSPTGCEAPLARLLAQRLLSVGLQSAVQHLDDTQASAVGELPGSGDGARVLLYAPIDTATAGDPDEDVPWIGPELRRDHLARAFVDGPYVAGLGASNPKGHAACVVAATEAIARAGVPLKGDLLVGLGAGGMPTDARPGSGRRNTGHGVGCSFMLERGLAPDVAVIAKPGWAASSDEVGVLWFDVKVSGTHSYVGSRHRIPYQSAIGNAATVVHELEAWFAEYSAIHTTVSASPQGAVGAIVGGWWRMPSFPPALTVLRVDLRTAPEADQRVIRREFGACITRIREQHPHIDVDWSQSLTIPGTSTDPRHPVIVAAREAWEHLERRPHEDLVGLSGATDANILRSRGVPTVRIGMPKVARPDVAADFQLGMNTVDLREMERLTGALIRIGVNLLTRPRVEVA